MNAGCAAEVWESPARRRKEPSPRRGRLRSVEGVTRDGAIRSFVIFDVLSGSIVVGENAVDDISHGELSLPVGGGAVARGVTTWVVTARGVAARGVAARHLWVR